MKELTLKIAKTTLDVIITSIVLLLLVLSLLPLVTLWSGIIALIWVNLAWFFYFRKKQQPRRLFKFWYKIGILTMFLGFFVHMGCRVYSNGRINELRKECNNEKNNVFSNNKINLEKPASLPK